MEIIDDQMYIDISPYNQVIQSGRRYLVIWVFCMLDVWM